jgi:hypothetical protein
LLEDIDMHRTRSVFAVTLMTLAGSVLANQPGTLMLKTGEVRVDDATNMLRANQARAQRLPERMVLVLDGPMTPLKRERIEAAGVQVGDYLPTNAFIVDTTNARIGALRALGFIESLVAFENEWKIDPLIGNRQLTSRERQEYAAQGKVASHVYLFAGASIVDGRKAIERMGGVEIMNQELIGDRFLIGVLGTDKASVSSLKSAPSSGSNPRPRSRSATTRHGGSFNRTSTGSIPCMTTGFVAKISSLRLWTDKST